MPPVVLNFRVVVIGLDLNDMELHCRKCKHSTRSLVQQCLSNVQCIQMMLIRSYVPMKPYGKMQHMKYVEMHGGWLAVTGIISFILWSGKEERENH